MRAALVCLLLLFLPVVSPGQPGRAIAVHAGLPNAPYAPYAEPATMDLIAKDPGAHPGKIWVRYTDDGLHIWGKVQVNDDDLHWPQEKSRMLASDHVETWLSESEGVSMPPVGYGNQFGENDLKSAADCTPLENAADAGTPRSPKVKDCELWYKDQLHYRSQFERLFTRQWLAAATSGAGPSKFFEDYATTAYANLDASFFEPELPKPLKPAQDEGIVSEFNTEFNKRVTLPDAAGNPRDRGIVTGYNFHFFIPYNAFPPAQQLDLRDLWLMVDVFGPAPEGKKMGALSTTSPQRVWGKPSSFNHLVLDAPRVHSITPCRMAAELPAWHFPLAGKEPLYLSTVYDIENPVAGYMYDPDGVSPIFSSNEYFWKTLPDGAYLSGPELTYRKGDTVASSKFYVDKTYFEMNTLPDGWTLVRTGPDMSTQSPLGSGQCGSCPVLDFHIYAVSPKGEIAPALDINDEFTGMEGKVDGGDLAIAPDWSRVTFYKKFVTYIDEGRGGEKDNWTSESYCLDGHMYKECGKNDNATQPTPPNFPEINGDPGD